MPPPDWSFERYRNLLRVLARRLILDPRLRTRVDESDLVQETFLRAGAGLDEFRGQTEGERIAWLKQILARTFCDELDKGRTQKRDVGREQSIEDAVNKSSMRLAELLTDAHSSPSQQAERNEMILRVAAAIEQLPDDQRDAVIQRRLLESPLSEIAEGMKKTERAVSGLVRRGMEKLGELLREYK